MFANCPRTDPDFQECVCYSELFADTGNRNHRNAGPYFLKAKQNSHQLGTYYEAWGKKNGV